MRVLRRAPVSGKSSGSEPTTWQSAFSLSITHNESRSSSVVFFKVLAPHAPSSGHYHPLKKKTQEEPTAECGGSMRRALAAIRRARCGYFDYFELEN